MTNDKYAFTFIEILVSISILSIMSIVGIGSFQKFFSVQQTTRVQEKIVNIKRGLDNDVQAGKISSYSLIFFSGSNSLIADIDYLNSPNLIRFDSFDPEALRGTLVTNNASTGVWETKMYVDGIFMKTWLENASGSSIPIDVSVYHSFDDIRIFSTINDKSANNLVFYRLDFTKGEGSATENTFITSLGGIFDEADLINELGKKRLKTIRGATVSYTGQIDIGLRRASSEMNFTLKP